MMHELRNSIIREFLAEGRGLTPEEARVETTRRERQIAGLCGPGLKNLAVSLRQRGIADLRQVAAEIRRAEEPAKVGDLTAQDLLGDSGM